MLSGSMSKKTSTTPRRPNIIFILTDQWRGDCLGAMGHPVVATPHLDSLAHTGTLFTAAYSSCPSCIASRAGMFTGLEPSVHGRLGYRDRVPWNYERMLPQLLADAGYQTGCVGKTHFYPQGVRLGFEQLQSYEGWQMFDRGYRNDYFEWLKEHTGGSVEEWDHGLTCNSWLGRASHLPEELHNNTWVVTKSIEYLRNRDRDRPLFLNVSFHRPHPPLDPPQTALDLYRDVPLPPVPVGDWAQRHDLAVEDVDAWQGRLPDHLLQLTRRAYYAQISHIDLQIGRLMTVLRREIQAGPTWIIFASDHGEMLGDHHLFRKTYAYEGSARVPLIIHSPDASATRRCSEPVVVEDLYPTLLQIAGVPLPERIDGRSLLPHTAEGPAAARPFVHGEHAACYSDDLGVQFLTDGREKYIWYTKTGREQLFDLEADPTELRDLARTRGRRKRLQTWRGRMIDLLADRPQDGLSDGRRLIPGRVLPDVRPELLR